MKSVIHLYLICLFVFFAGNAHAALTWAPYPNGNFDLNVSGNLLGEKEYLLDLNIAPNIIGAHTDLQFSSFTPNGSVNSWITVAELEMEVIFTNDDAATIAIERTGDGTTKGVALLEARAGDHKDADSLGSIQFGSFGIALLNDRVAFYQSFNEFYAVFYADLGYTPEIQYILIESFAFDGALIGSASNTFTATMDPVPIPGAIWLLGSGLLGLAGVNRRKK